MAKSNTNLAEGRNFSKELTQIPLGNRANTYLDELQSSLPHAPY